MTGDQRHRNDIVNGQRGSRHSLPSLCFLFFPHHTFFKNKCEAFTSSDEKQIRQASNCKPARPESFRDRPFCVLIFFPNAQEKLNFYCHRTNEVHEHQKPIMNPFVNGTYAFALPITIGTQADPSAKAKRAIF